MGTCKLHLEVDGVYVLVSVSVWHVPLCIPNQINVNPAIKNPGFLNPPRGPKFIFRSEDLRILIRNIGTTVQKISRGSKTGYSIRTWPYKFKKKFKPVSRIRFILIRLGLRFVNIRIRIRLIIKKLQLFLIPYFLQITQKIIYYYINIKIYYFKRTKHS